MDAINLLDSTYKEVKELVFEIYNYNTCKNCAGSFLNVTCKHCGAFDKYLDGLVTKLNVELTKLYNNLGELNLNAVPNNKLFNLLMILKDRDIPLVSMLLEDFNYKDNYYALYKSSLEKQMAGKEFTELELSAIESMIYTNNPNVDLVNYYNLFIRNAMLKQQNVSYDCFKVLIKRFLEMQMKNVYFNAECIIDNTLRRECGGNSLFTKTRLNEIDVKNLYDGKSVFLIFIMTHELQHTYQYKEMFTDNNYITPFIMDKIKEYVLHILNPNYYLQNHDDISFEKEAQSNGIIDALNYFRAIGIELLNEKKYLVQKAELDNKMFDQKRVLDGKETTMDLEFSKVIPNHPEALIKYKKLNLLYKVVDGIVVAKSQEELSQDLEIVLNNPSLDDETINMYKEFYNHYLTGSRNF